jgi:hypothetical protein
MLAADQALSHCHKGENRMVVSGCVVVVNFVTRPIQRGFVFVVVVVVVVFPHS